MTAVKMALTAICVLGFATAASACPFKVESPDKQAETVLQPKTTS